MTGGLFLGKESDSGEDLRLKAKRLTTHGVVVGMTGSGKTGLCLVLLEELVREGVPIIAIDPKGDLGNLDLVFRDLAPESFAPWAGDNDPTQLSERWKEGLARWGLGPAEVNGLRDRLDVTVYTPGSEAGVPVDIMGSFARPADHVLADPEARRELVSDTVSGLLGLVGHDSDPVRDPAHIVLSQILDAAWEAGENPDLEALILKLVDPPFTKVGVFPLDRFYKPDDRMELAMALNGVIASPGFAPWTKGAAIDVDRMLRPGAKVPVHVFSLSHLDNSERTFFLGLLLSQIMAWSRGQPGTEDLRALLFFDEVAGYMPPHPKNPPTKAPLLTMMKQARAVGLGVVLSTQNPVDIDYKALSNAGTWCIGRLGTPQDRARLLKGLGDPGLDERVAALEKREFLLHMVGRGAPRVFRSRHAMCYLRGPFTRTEVRKLTALKGPPAAPEPAASSSAPPAPAAPAAPSIPEGLSSSPPPISQVQELFLDPRVAFAARLQNRFAGSAEARQADGKVLYRPALHAHLKLRFDEDRVGFVLNQDIHRVWFPLDATLPDEAHEVGLERADLLTTPPTDALFAELPAWMDGAQELTALEKRVKDDTYRSETAGMFVCKPLRLYGKAGETREAFEARCKAAIDDIVDDKVGALKKKADGKVDRLEDRIATREAKLVDQEGVARSKQLSEVVNIGETLWSMFSGRSRSMSSAVTRRQSTRSAQARVGALADEIAQLQEEANELIEDVEREIADLEADQLEALDAIEESEVRLEKTDIVVARFGILWIPVTRRL